MFSGNYSDLNGRPSIPAAITDLADVDLPNPTPNNTYLKWDSTALRWVQGTGASGLADIVEDTSPQLGGNLDCNNFDIQGNLNTTIEVGGSTNKIKFLYNACLLYTSPSPRD